MKRLPLDLGDRSYDILIGRGILPRAAQFLPENLKPSRVVVITHPSINALYGKSLIESFARTGYAADCIEIPEGEASKSLAQAEIIYDRLMEWNCDRQSLLVALGGGVVGDLTGFIAATYFRGVPFIQVPTTLLSQVDSSVGGKTAVNHPRGKNIIGAFHQPRLVVIDLETLRTLPANEYRAGMAEIIKYGVIEDAELFAFLESHVEKILAQDTLCLERIIETSCAIKARVVEKDETEGHYRMVLNFGHTIGHAIEALTGYSTMIHGDAVAIGMVHVAKLSQLTGRCAEQIPQRIRRLVAAFGLPTELPRFKAEEYIRTMSRDKKATQNKIRFVLVKDIGSVEIADDVPVDKIRAALIE